MSSKPKEFSYECSACGDRHSKWHGQCSSCQQWNTITEVIAPTVSSGYTAKFNSLSKNHLTPSDAVIELKDINISAIKRVDTAMNELNRVLGGGLAQGSVILLGGDPGIGKSTLLLQMVANLAQKHKVLYVTAEESKEQIALRAQRLEINSIANLLLLAEVNLATISNAIESITPEIIIIDSIQTIYTDFIQSSPGSVAQVRECASLLTRIAKFKHVTIIMIGHVTKDGSLAGPRVLEHIVDSVLYFEGDSNSNFRLLRSVKNRFGAVNELGVFVMTDRGLKEINNPSALFLSSYKTNTPGSSILITQEGTRPLLVEVQALVDQSHIMPAKRLAVGMDSARLAMLIAIMQRHLHLRLFDQDIFLNIVGGIKINEPAIDLAVALSIISSFKNKALPANLAIFGEIGLAGEIRTVQKGQERIKEAAKLGFNKIIIPKANTPQHAVANVEIIAADNLAQIVALCF